MVFDDEPWWWLLVGCGVWEFWFDGVVFVDGGVVGFVVVGCFVVVEWVVCGVGGVELLLLGGLFGVCLALFVFLGGVVIVVAAVVGVIGGVEVVVSVEVVEGDAVVVVEVVIDGVNVIVGLVWFFMEKRSEFMFVVGFCSLWVSRWVLVALVALVVSVIMFVVVVLIRSFLMFMIIMVCLSW